MESVSDLEVPQAAATEEDGTDSVIYPTEAVPSQVRSAISYLQF